MIVPHTPNHGCRQTEILPVKISKVWSTIRERRVHRGTRAPVQTTRLTASRLFSPGAAGPIMRSFAISKTMMVSMMCCLAQIPLATTGNYMKGCIAGAIT